MSFSTLKWGSQRRNRGRYQFLLPSSSMLTGTRTAGTSADLALIQQGSTFVVTMSYHLVNCSRSSGGIASISTMMSVLTP